MRRLYYDCYEFDEVCSEEQLELTIATRKQFQTLADFATECGIPANGDPPPQHWSYWEHICRYMRRFASLELSPLNECNVLVIRDEWNDLEIAIETPNEFIWSHWSTSA